MAAADVGRGRGAAVVGDLELELSYPVADDDASAFVSASWTIRYAIRRERVERNARLGVAAH